MPVSYTHLDVYKRQAAPDVVLVVLDPVIETALDSFDAVSYTHLDVYKRQAQIIARYQREGDAASETFDPLELDRFSTLQQLSRCLLYTSRCV